MTRPLIIVYPQHFALPPQWQPGWGLSCTIDLGSLPRRLVARAPAGTPIPAGAQEWTPPKITDDDRRKAWDDISELLSLTKEARKSVETEWRITALERALEVRDTLDRHITAWLGERHPYALCSPLSLTRAEAISDHVDAETLWASPASVAVIRTAPAGFSVWAGIGGLMIPAGSAGTYQEAERLALAAVRHHRTDLLARVRGLLAGWAGDTPYFSATLDTAADALPIFIRRGPMTAAELPSHSGESTSWDLPVTAEFVGGEVTRHPERVTWDDDTSRERQRQRQRAGTKRHAAEVARALDLLRAYPAIAPYVREHDLAPATIAVPRGVVQLVGPVCMRDDAECPLALVREARPGGRTRQYWMTIGTFATLGSRQ